MLTESQIESRAEKMQDHLDAKFLTGEVSQAEYDAEVKRIDQWARMMINATPDATIPAAA